MTYTTCPYCGVGCGVIADVQGDCTTVRGDVDHPANQGRLCIKGTHLGDIPTEMDRLLYPSIGGERTSWGSAIEAVANGFKRTIEHFGPDSVAFYLSGQLLTEDYYVANKLMKGFIGSANVDTNSRLCMASAVASHKRAFGEDVVPCDYTDLDKCDLIILVGSNTAWAHPVLYQRIAQRKADGELKVVVVDPRVTETCAIADLHLKIRPGSDVALFNGLLAYLDRQAATDITYIEQATEGFRYALTAALESESRVSEFTGLSRTELDAFYSLFTRNPRVVTFYSQGVNQSVQGTDKANAIINCHLATGRIGVVGAGPFSITGQPNAMGGREVGGMANQLAAHMDFDEASVDRVQRFWQTSSVATQPGLKAVDLFDAIADGRIKAVWILGTNPAVSLPNSAKVRQALQDCPFVVVSDCMLTTDTAKYADVLLPAQGWGEKNGTVTNSERYVSRQRAFRSAPGLARADWRVICDVALEMGFGDAFQYAGVEEVFSEHVALTDFENDGERLLNLAHLQVSGVEDYDALIPTQWPAGKKPFADQCFSTADGLARFVPVHQQVLLPLQTSELILNTGRLRDQWHTMTRTGYSGKLYNHTRFATLDMHPADAERRGIRQDDLVNVDNGLGALKFLVNLTEQQNAGEVFAPIHWSGQFSGDACVSEVIPARVDPISGQPESKLARVHVTRIEVAGWVAIVAHTRFGDDELKGSPACYWSRSVVDGKWCYLIALSDLSDIADCRPHATDSVEYRHGSVMRMLGRVDGQISWLAFTATQLADLPTMEHIYTQLNSDLSDWQRLARHSFDASDTSPTICSCFEISRDQILDAIATGADSVEALGKALQCGTNCGSCVPELTNFLAVQPSLVRHG